MIIKTKTYLTTIGILVTIVITLSISCCRKNVTGPDIVPDPEAYWNHFLFHNTLDNFITNGIVVDDKLMVVTRSGIFELRDFDDIYGASYTLYNHPGMNVGSNHRPVMSRDFTVYHADFWGLFDQSRITFASYQPVVQRGLFANRFVSTANIGEQFSNCIFVKGDQQIEFGAVNKQNRFITVMQDGRHLLEIMNNYIVYIDIDVCDSRGVIIRDTGVFNVPSFLQARINITAYFVYNDYFYLACMIDRGESITWLIEISPEGIIREIFNPFDGRAILNFFEHQGYLWAHTSGFRLFKTKDAINWIPIGTLSPLNLKVNEIDDYLFIFIQDRIYIWDICVVGGIFTGYTLPTDNMKGSNITSVHKQKNNLVITTSNGIFYKPFEEVMNDKQLRTSSRGIDL